MKITLKFGDNDILSEIYVDGRYCTEPRLQNYVLNKPVDRWLEPFNTRHVVWKGFLAEMSELFNTRHFDIEFVGNSDAYDKFLSRTNELIPVNFNVSFKLEESPTEDNASALDSNFIEQLLSMLRDTEASQIKFLAMKLRKIRNVIDKINCNVIYENDRETQFLQQMSDCPIRIEGKLREISIPIILTSDKNFPADPYELCRQQQLEPSDAMIIVVGKNQKEVKSRAMHLKQIWKDISIFALTDSPNIDCAEIEQITRLYNFYKKKVFRRLITSCPEDTWTDPQSVKNLIAKL